MNIYKLKMEIILDLLTRGYVEMTDEEVADSMNNVFDRPYNRTSMTGREIAAENVDSEYDSIPE